MKAGDKARVVQPTIEGTIIERRFNKDDDLELLLEWTDEKGESQSRWFTESQLTKVEG